MRSENTCLDHPWEDSSVIFCDWYLLLLTHGAALLLQYSVTITEQGCVIAHEIFGMVESSVAVHSTPFQLFTNSQLMLRPDITTNLWPAPIQSRILKKSLSVSTVWESAGQHYHSFSPFCENIKFRLSNSDGSCWSSPVLRILHSETEEMQVEKICDFLSPEDTSFQPSLSQQSLSTWSPAVTPSSPCVAWGFPQIPRQCPLHLLPPSGISGPWPQHMSHKSDHHRSDLQEDTGALWSK